VNLFVNMLPFMAMLAALSLLEWALPVGCFSWRSRVAGFLYWFVNLALGAMLLVLLNFLWRRVGVQPLVKVPLGQFGVVAAVILALLIADLTAYWNHRLEHRLFWRVHSLDHSVTDLNAANGYAHFSEKGFRFLFFSIPLSLIHFDQPSIPVALAMGREMLERYIHSPTRLHFGALRWIFVDNRFHRIHHSAEERHFEKNFGILFSFWDRLFGTAWEPAKDEWPATGVKGVSPPRSLADCLLFPIRQRRSDTSAVADAAPDPYLT
jgi:sterol desaturase/sphingolipid hydroxylase (fatty acid hydroxylase superfamily)